MYNFDLSSPGYTKELEAIRAWEKEHHKRGKCKFYDDGSSLAPPTGAIGGRLTFSFTPTGLGAIVVVSCACGAEKNVPDFDSW